MSAGPVHAADRPARLSGWGNTAFNSQNSLAGLLPPHLSGYQRAVRANPSRCRALLFKLLNNSFRSFTDAFKFGGSAPVGRRIAGRAYRPSDARPVVTKILVGPDCSPILTNALCCTTGQIITQEYDVVLHASKIGRETYQRAVRPVPKCGRQGGHQRNV